MVAMYVNVTKITINNYDLACPQHRLKTLDKKKKLKFGRRALLLVDNILGVPSTSGTGTRLEYTRRAVENMQLTYEIARRKLQERADKQAESKEKLSIP